MKDGHTKLIDMADRRYAGGPVIGLFEIRERTLHKFSDLQLRQSETTEWSIGRARSCDIQLLDCTVSLLHCKVTCGASGAWEIIDANSTNGVVVNDLRVSRAVLVPGMWIFLGRTELIAMGPDGAIPITATTNTSFLYKAAAYYGSDRKAAARIGKSAATVRRARQRQRRRQHGDSSQHRCDDA
ncbi:FHA domain containing protein [Haliangium ochraceum DSM 14365]|uniref:FHA domain containing protein n=2 Tax=Haliangium ochraceum TaxID=80816 RepID=D0LU41_HALO1|nr:FHA domain containing protein [Haliangium ochraceum DSM 14365]